MNMKRIMKKAHKIAKELIGDYAARMSAALKMAWAEFKNRDAETVKTVRYYDYKNSGYGCFKTVQNSYNASKKTIDIIVPADEKKMLVKMIEYKFHGLDGAIIYDEIKQAVSTCETIEEARIKVTLLGINCHYDIPDIFKMLGYVA